jgi:hypothetical protein
MTVGARLSYPSCSDLSTSAGAIEAQYVYSGFLDPRTVQYFRLGPEHFFTSTALTLRVMLYLIFIYLKQILNLVFIYSTV